MVASYAGCREIVEDILCLMKCHQTHTKQGEAARKNTIHVIRPDIVYANKKTCKYAA